MKSLRYLIGTLLIALPLHLFALDTTDKVAIITGSSSGLGYELTQLAIKSKMRLVLVDKDPENSEVLADQYRKNGGQALVIAADLSHAEQRKPIVDRTLQVFGRVDYLFNNAGYSYITSIVDYEASEARRNFEVNYWAYVDLAHQVIPVMATQQSGIIVNIGSILGFTPANPQLAVYSANKHALAGYFLSIAPALKAQGVDVKVVFPAGMKTNIFQNAVGKNLDKSQDISVNWEHPSIVAGEVFNALHDGKTVQFPSVSKAVARRYLKDMANLVE